MGKLILFVMVMIGVSTSLAAQVLSIGGVDGGGGKGVLCVNNGKPVVESLDLYEAKNVWGYRLPPSGDLDAEIWRVWPRYYSAALERPEEPPFKYERWSTVQEKEFYQKNFIDLMRSIPSGSRLSPTQDATIILDPPPNCRIVQILVYLDEGIETGGVLVDSEYWDLLDDQNKYALYLHEMEYKAHRSYSGIQSSDAIRKSIGALFSVNQFPSRIDPLRKADTLLKCEGQGENPVVFYATPIPDQDDTPISNPKSYLYFERFGKYGMRKSTRVQYKAMTHLTIRNLLNLPGDGLISSKSPLYVSSIVGGVKIEMSFGKTCSPVINPNCPSETFFLSQNDKGETVQDRITCKQIKVIKEYATTLPMR